MYEIWKWFKTMIAMTQVKNVDRCSLPIFDVFFYSFYTLVQGKNIYFRQIQRIFIRHRSQSHSLNIFCFISFCIYSTDHNSMQQTSNNEILGTNNSQIDGGSDMAERNGVSLEGVFAFNNLC